MELEIVYVTKATADSLVEILKMYHLKDDKNTNNDFDGNINSFNFLDILGHLNSKSGIKFIDKNFDVIKIRENLTRKVYHKNTDCGAMYLDFKSGEKLILNSGPNEDQNLLGIQLSRSNLEYIGFAGCAFCYGEVIESL